MRNKDRIQSTCDALASAWGVVPDWRLMQFLCNFQSWLGKDGFYLEEDELAYKLGEYSIYLASGGKYM